MPAIEDQTFNPYKVSRQEPEGYETNYDSSKVRNNLSITSSEYSDAPMLLQMVREREATKIHEQPQVIEAQTTRLDLETKVGREVVDASCEYLSVVHASPVKVQSPTSSIPSLGSTISFPTSTPTTPFRPSVPTTQRHWFAFASGCERPRWLPLILHLASCLLSFVAIYFIPNMADQKTVSWARAITGLAGGVCGFALGFTFMRLLRQFLSAAVWATVIHQSKGEGMCLNDLVTYSEEPANFLGAAKLLYSRWKYPGTARKSRKDYDKLPWSIFILIFVLLYVLSQCVAFLIGRIIDIEPIFKHQKDAYHEISVAGDLSQFDIEKATNLTSVFEERFELTWTLTPSTSKPPAISFPWEGDDVYFAETTFNQLVPGGAGLGTGTFNYTTERNTSVTGEFQNGALLWYPRWGIRAKCRQIASSQTIIQRSQTDNTYLFIPRNVLLELFKDFEMELPARFSQPYDPLNNQTLAPGDSLTGDAEIASNSSMFAMGARFWDNGVASSYYSQPVDQGENGNGWVTIEAVLVRLNNTYAPKATFPVWGDSIIFNGIESKIGYDAAVCVEMFEPYVLETFNSSALPYSTRIVGKANTARGDFGAQGNQGKKVGGLEDDEVHIGLNSSGLYGVYETLHENSVNMMLKDNGRDSFYVPNPSLISFTSGQGWNDYTSFDADLFAKAKASADASNMLPYFAGSAKVLARRYEDVESASVTCRVPLLTILIASVWMIGTFAGLFVPRLPMGVPRREFRLYSWLAALVGGELQILPVKDGKNVAYLRYMDLDDIEEQYKNARVKYNFPMESTMQKV